MVACSLGKSEPAELAVWRFRQSSVQALAKLLTPLCSLKPDFSITQSPNRIIIGLKTRYGDIGMLNIQVILTLTKYSNTLKLS